jgi:hypothetical protein
VVSTMTIIYTKHGGRGDNGPTTVEQSPHGDASSRDA